MGHLAPLKDPASGGCHWSPIRFVLKGTSLTNSDRLSTSPAWREANVNDGVDPELCSLEYPTVDTVVAMMLKMEHGA